MLQERRVQVCRDRRPVFPCLVCFIISVITIVIVMVTSYKSNSKATFFAASLLTT